MQLNVLSSQQALVGLVGRRGNLRNQPGEWDQNDNVDLGDNYRQEEAQRVQNSLSKDDSQNLEKIIGNMIRMQEDAATAAPRMMITAPLHGRLIRLQRGLQVKPNAPMFIHFHAEKQAVEDQASTSVAQISVWLIVVSVGLALVHLAESKWNRLNTLFVVVEKERILVDIPQHTGA